MYSVILLSQHGLALCIQADGYSLPHTPSHSPARMHCLKLAHRGVRTDGGVARWRSCMRATNSSMCCSRKMPFSLYVLMLVSLPACADPTAQYRAWKMTAMQILAPIAFLLLLLILQVVPHDAPYADADPDTRPIPVIPPCIVRGLVLQSH